MTTDEAIAFARERGWHIWSMSEMSAGGFRVRMHSPTRARVATGKPGYSDALTDYGEGPTPADAVLRALCLRYDRATGKVTEQDVPPFSQAAEDRLAAALSAAVEARRLEPVDLIPPTTWAPLLAALGAATQARQGRRR